MSNKKSYNIYGNIVAFVWVLSAFFISGLWVYLVLVQPSSKLTSDKNRSFSDALLEEFSDKSFYISNSKASSYLTLPEIRQRVLPMNNWNNDENYSKISSKFLSDSVSSEGKFLSLPSPASNYGLYLGNHSDLSSLRSELDRVHSLDSSVLSSLSAYYYVTSVNDTSIVQLVLGSLSDVNEASYLCKTLISLSFSCDVGNFLSSLD